MRTLSVTIGAVAALAAAATLWVENGDLPATTTGADATATATAEVVAAAPRAPSALQRFIVQGPSHEQARAWVEAAGGEIISVLPVIRGVGARLSAQQVAALREQPGLRLQRDRNLQLSDDDDDEREGQAQQPAVSPFAAWIGADRVHASGIDGSGVTVAFIDTGLWQRAARHARLRAQVDLVGDATVEQPGRQPQDGYGHGTHIMSTVAHPAYERNARYTGIAPGADLVSVRAFDDAGLGSYIDVIEGIEWVLRQREALDIRVLNLSFGAQPQSRYWDDPLNQAVMAAWEAGIVVVASAGNEGPDAMTIGVPGNVPYVITVGAASDNHTWRDVSDDFLSTFSSAGPTTEAFVKPDLLGPGDRVLGLMPPASHLAQTYGAQSQVRGAYHALSGTSQAAAITSGVAALLLQADPGLDPDTVKCRLMASAQLAMASESTLQYSLFQQGAGLVNAWEAVHSDARDCANVGMDVAADLAGEQHYMGPAAMSEAGDFYIVDAEGYPIEADGYVWGGRYTQSQGYIWGGRNLFSLGYTWGGRYLQSQGYTWGGRVNPDGYTWGGRVDPDGYTWGGRVEPDGYTWGGRVEPDGYTWGGRNTAVLGVNRYVAPEEAR